MTLTIEVSDDELIMLQRIRNHFGPGKAIFEHSAYSVLDELIKKLKKADTFGNEKMVKK